MLSLVSVLEDIDYSSFLRNTNMMKAKVTERFRKPVKAQ